MSILQGICNCSIVLYICLYASTLLFWLFFVYHGSVVCSVTIHVATFILLFFFSIKMFIYLESFVNSHEYQDTYSVKSIINMMGIILNLWIVLSSIDIFMILILVSHEYGRVLCLSALLSILFTSILHLHYACVSFQQLFIFYWLLFIQHSFHKAILGK